MARWQQCQTRALGDCIGRSSATTPVRRTTVLLPRTATPPRTTTPTRTSTPPLVAQYRAPPEARSSSGFVAGSLQGGQQSATQGVRHCAQQCPLEAGAEAGSPGAALRRLLADEGPTWPAATAPPLQGPSLSDSVHCLSRMPQTEDLQDVADLRRTQSMMDMLRAENEALRAENVAKQDARARLESENLRLWDQMQGYRRTMDAMSQQLLVMQEAMRSGSAHNGTSASTGVGSGSNQSLWSPDTAPSSSSRASVAHVEPAASCETAAQRDERVELAAAKELRGWRQLSSTGLPEEETKGEANTSAHLSVHEAQKVDSARADAAEERQSGQPAESPQAAAPRQSSSPAPAFAFASLQAETRTLRSRIEALRSSSVLGNSSGSTGAPSAVASSSALGDDAPRQSWGTLTAAMPPQSERALDVAYAALCRSVPRAAQTRGDGWSPPPQAGRRSRSAGPLQPSAILLQQPLVVAPFAYCLADQRSCSVPAPARKPPAATAAACAVPAAPASTCLRSSSVPAPARQPPTAAAAACAGAPGSGSSSFRVASPQSFVLRPVPRVAAPASFTAALASFTAAPASFTPPRSPIVVPRSPIVAPWQAVSAGAAHGTQPVPERPVARHHSPHMICRGEGPAGSFTSLNVGTRSCSVPSGFRGPPASESFRGGQPDTAQVLWDRVPDAEALRVQAMKMAVRPGAYEDEESGGQVEADWSDVMQYWRGVGGSALRSAGVEHGSIRKLGLM